MRKRIVTVFALVLLVIGIAFMTFILTGVINLANTSPNTAPGVIPSLREWQGGFGSFTMGPGSRIAVDSPYAAQLQETARIFQGDLFDATGYLLPVVTKSVPATGDFFLTLLRTTDRGLGKEGYLFNVGNAVVISANTSTGVFYGTRSALQILVQDPAKAHMVKGKARDYPEYQERGFMLDVGRKFFPLSFLEDYVKFMAWYKMDDFQLHLNDNAIDAGKSPDWRHQYAAFRLNSDRFKGLAARDGSYTEQDMRELQAVAKAYAVTITPEIDAPAHDLALTQYHPDLASPKYPKEMLDLDNPNTYTFVKAIWDEFLPWFDTAQVHIGADEYSLSGADHYRQFINTLDAYLRKKGKTVSMWGSLTVMKSNIKIDTAITIDDWDNSWANPVDMVRQGFHIINANGKLLYIVPKAGYFHDYLDTKLLYEQWEPNIFALANSRLNLLPNDPHLLGGMFAEWNDKLGSVISDADVHERVKPAMQTLSQKLWSASMAGMTYDQFQQLAQEIGDAPGTHLPQTTLAGALNHYAAVFSSYRLTPPEDARQRYQYIHRGLYVSLIA